MVKKKTDKTTSKTVVAAAKQAEAKAVKPAPSNNYQKLHTWNKLLAVVFAVQAVLVLVFSKAVSTPVTMTYQAVDPLASEAAKHEVLATASRHLFDLRVACVLAAALFAFAIGHLLMATFFRKRYELDLQLGLNRWRWANLGVGGGLLLVAVCMLSGVQQLSLLIGVLFLTVTACLITLITERLIRVNKGREPKMGHVLCMVAMASAALPWLLLACGALGVWLFDGKLPGYLYLVYGTGAVMTLVIATVTNFRMLERGKWADSVYTERVYMVLGLATAALVVWQIFAGALI